MANRRRKASRSVAYQVRWKIGSRELLRQVRGEVQRERLKMTLAALPWVEQVEFVQLRR
jgi:hypothetical protein